MNRTQTCQRIGTGSSNAMPISTQFENDTTIERQPMPLYHTIVHNCNCHSFDDVAFGLMKIVGTGLRDAELKAKEIDFFGRAVVATCPLETAEHYATRLRDEVISMTGSRLRTSVEPA